MASPWHDKDFINSIDNPNVLAGYENRYGIKFDLKSNETMFYNISTNTYYVWRKLSTKERYEFVVIGSTQENHNEVTQQSLKDSLETLQEINENVTNPASLFKSAPDMFKQIKTVRAKALEVVEANLKSVFKQFLHENEVTSKILNNPQFRKLIFDSKNILTKFKTFKSNITDLSQSKLGKKLLGKMFDRVVSFGDIDEILDLFLFLL